MSITSEIIGESFKSLSALYEKGKGCRESSIFPQFLIGLLNALIFNVKDEFKPIPDIVEDQPSLSADI